MAGSTRTVRRVQTSRVADFDDQLWPINCALLILAGFVTGIVMATSKFDDPRILYNGWVRLFGIAATLGLLFWGVMWLQGKILRRLQLCLLISLLGHLCLAVYLHERYLALVAEWESKSPDQVIEQYQQITLPDYSWQQIEQPHTQQSFEEPIETEAPRPADPEAVKRKAKEPDIPTETPPPDQPEIPQRQQPNPAITRRTELSAPRRAEAAAGAQISRQQWKDRPSPNQPIPEPEITLQPRQAATVPDGTFAPGTRADVRFRVDQQQTFEGTVGERPEQIEVRLPRRIARQEPTPDARAAPAPTHQVSRPAQIPPSQAVTPDRVEVARRSPRVAPRPADMASARQQASRPRVVRPAGDPAPATPRAASAVALGAARQPRTEENPSLERPTRAAAVRRRAELVMPADLVGPRSETVARRADSPDPAARPIAGPTTTAVSRAADGLARVVRDVSGSRPLPPMSNATELPSAVAARRRAASTRQPDGVEAVPATPSTLARFAASADLPSTAIAVEAQPAATPAAAGGTPASRLPVVSGAAVLRSAGQAPLGDATTAAGTADFALGSAEVVARTGQPRSAGMGRSSATANTTMPRIARAVGPPAPTAASDIVAASPTLPGVVASGPSQPSVPSLNAQASATRRGGTVRPFAAKPAVGAGPSGSSGTPGPVGVAQSSRVTRHESTASAIAGGGTPRPGRTVGGAVAPNAVAEASQPAAARGGRTSRAAPWQAQVSGPRRPISGLPGGLQSQPMAGALASLDSRGAPFLSAAARRAVASQPEQGGRDTGSRRSSTIRRANTGIDLPAAAVAVDHAPQAGAGGVAVEQGGLTSSLPKGLSATVRQAAAELAVGQTAAAAGTSESPLGSAEAVVMAGWTRAVGNDLPAPGPSAAPRRIGRTAATGTTIADSGTLRTDSVAKAPASDSAAEAGDNGQTTAGAAVARGSGRLPAVAATQVPNAGASPGATALAATSLGGAGPDSATMTASRRRISESDGPEQSPVGVIGRGPQRTADAPGLISAAAETIERPPIATAASGASGEAVELSGAISGEPSRPEGGLPVRIAAVEGPGGLGYLPSPEVGIPSRRARPESEVIHTNFRRFINRPSGGRVAIDGRVRQQPTEAFRQRDPGRRAQVAQAWGGSEGTEAAVEMGLDYFARLQFPDGHWSLHELPEGIEYQDAALGEMEADSAATGLALLCYLGAGYTHLDGKFRGEVGRGIDWLVRHQKPDGELFTGGTKYTRFYSHGIAAIALCEAYGMTRDHELRRPARKAIEFIINTQHPSRGGWRYDLHPQTGRATETDTSVSGWMLMALKSAQMAGLEVPSEVLEKLDAWLDTARAAGAEGQYVYNPHALDTSEQRGGRRPNLAMTSEAMLMRMYLGRDRHDPRLIVGADHLKENLPEVGTRAKPRRDCYYWYYATQAMFQMQDDYWTAWNGRLRRLATGSQVTSGQQAGSWHPLRPVEDRWGRAGGRHYVTALHLLMLEVYYRHLPLFRELSK